jgi:predicted heme/steroid binding protein/uncharacterized membrane protein
MEPKRFTRQELAGFDGRDGRPAYIAYQGRVIDVSGSRMWRGGTHMKRHQAGQDLSGEIEKAPHGREVLDRCPQVGVLAEEPATGPTAPAPAPVPPPRPVGALEGFLERHPFFKRHPHPMTVHFPIVTMIFTPLFILLYLLTGEPGFEFTAMSCLGTGLLFCLVVIPTGLFTWWVNYGARFFPAVIIKLALSLFMFADGLAALLWRVLDPAVDGGGRVNGLWLALVLALLPAVVVVAWYGATLTFPLARDKRRE